MIMYEDVVVFGIEDILRSLCNLVIKVLIIVIQSLICYFGMVQCIIKICLKLDIGCFVLFDGGFLGFVVINFFVVVVMEMYESYMLSMGMVKDELVSLYILDEVSNVMGELMNQIVGDFIGKVVCEL